MYWQERSQTVAVSSWFAQLINTPQTEASTSEIHANR